MMVQSILEFEHFICDVSQRFAFQVLLLHDVSKHFGRFIRIVFPNILEFGRFI